ncbi:SmE [Symbiodinium pilosum]|uniref:SmE protein n=1 Tax=Symbiodinium pilosum TaxID=2952 RepID=A0A812LSG4_SYMPI|nr:SmE [Symbiodinium pilosum]
MKIRHAGLSLIGCLLLCAQAVKRPSVGTPFTAPAGDHYRTVLSLLETHSALSSEERNEIHELLTGVSAQTVSDVRHFDRYLRSFAAALVSLSEKAGGPHLQSALTKIMGVIEKTLKPGILDQHVAAQKAITRADEGVQECYNALWRGLNASNAVRDSLVNKSKAIKSCYRFAAAASDNVSAALISLPRLLTARSADCEKLLAASDVSQAPLQDWATRCDHHDSPSVGTYLMKQLMHWEELLQQYDDIEKRCKESTASYETQVTRYNSMKSHQQDGRDCTSLQDDMDAAACKQALDRIDSCGTYGSCIKDSISDRASLHASQCKIEVSLKAQWFALESIKCFLEAYKDHEGSEDGCKFIRCMDGKTFAFASGLVFEICHLQISQSRELQA